MTDIERNRGNAGGRGTVRSKGSPRAFGARPRVRAARTLTTALAVSVLLAAPLAGLQQTAPRPSADRGWLGVDVGQRFECRWEAAERWKPCSLVLHVAGVVEGGPAASAGVLPGDRLVALNGEPFTLRTIERQLASLRVGTPVSIDFDREGARRYVQLTPARRPARRVAVLAPDAPRVERIAAPETYVVTLSRLDRSDGSNAFALTIRGRGETVQVQPAAVRVIGGEVHVRQLDDDVELIEALSPIRLDIAEGIRAISDSTYRYVGRVLQSLEGRFASPELAERWVEAGSERLWSVMRTAFGRWVAGAEFQPVEADTHESKGLLVVRLAPGTPAHRAGLRPGDVVTRVGGEACTEVSALLEAVERQGPVRVTWVRRGREMSGALRPD